MDVTAIDPERLGQWFWECHRPDVTHLVIVANASTEGLVTLMCVRVWQGQDPRQVAAVFGETDPATGFPTLPNQEGQSVLAVLSAQRDLGAQIAADSLFHFD